MSVIKRRVPSGSLFFTVAAVAVLGGCASFNAGRNQALSDPAAFVAQGAALETTQAHRFGPEDVVTVSVFRAPEVSGEFKVDSVGEIAVPLIGKVRAQGATTDELAGALQRELGRKYYQNPNVTVAMKSTSPKRFTVDGAVRSPGVFSLPVQGRTTLVTAVAMAGGENQDANSRRVVVFRQIEGKKMAAAFDLRAIRRGQGEDPVVFESDIIVLEGPSALRSGLRTLLTTLPIVGLGIFQQVIF